jgi:hypothetical protein
MGSAKPKAPLDNKGRLIAGLRREFRHLPVPSTKADHNEFEHKICGDLGQTWRVMAMALRAQPVVARIS